MLRSLNPENASIIGFFIAAEIAEALISAHTSGIIHRDIKPENVMVLENGKIKLMDFGIAKIAENANSTQTGTFMGSPSYMSPEQIKGVDVDEGTDIYSLSVVLYELICGILPYTGSSTADVINRILVGNYKEPTEHVKNLDLKLEDIIVKGLEKKSRDRYRSMSDLKNTLTVSLNLIIFYQVRLFCRNTLALIMTSSTFWRSEDQSVQRSTQLLEKTHPLV